MAKTESTFTNMVLTLFFVTFISSTALGFFYEITKMPIKKAALAKKIKAIKKVVPPFTNNPIDDQYTVSSDLGELTFYPAMKDEKLVATAIQSFSNQGFGGRIDLMVGIVPDETIYDIAVLSHRETPGLGDKMDRKKSNFSEQFKGKNPNLFKFEVKKDGGDVDAITAATISSRAFCDAVKRAYHTDNKQKGLKEKNGSM